MDFGRKYLMRIFAYSSAFLVIYSIQLIFILLDFFDIIQIEMPKDLLVKTIFDSSVLLTLLLIMLYTGALINKQFMTHKEIVLTIKETILFVKENIEEVLNKDKKYIGAYMKMI